MPSTASVSAYSLLRQQFIAGRISRLAPALHEFSRFYGVGIASPNLGFTGGERFDDRQFYYDIFDNTRLLSVARPPETGPATVIPKPVGSVKGTGIRSYMKRPFTYERLQRFRPLGGAMGQIDKGGQAYLAAQADNLLQQAANAREFCFVNMMRGGFDLKYSTSGEDIRFLERGDGDTTVNFQIPAAHYGRMDSLVDNATSWATPSTDIAGQLLELEARAPRLSGAPVTEVWINSNLFAEILTNTSLQATGGSALRVFERIRNMSTGQDLDVGQWEGPRGGAVYTVNLRAIPQFNFHVYNGGLTINTDADSTTTTYWKPYVPSTKVIITPPPAPGTWYAMAEIGEMVQEDFDQGPKMVYGFHAWRRKIMDPVPGVELRIIDNFAPILKVPNAVFSPTVVW